MQIKITKDKTSFQAECLTFDPDKPKDIKKVIKETTIPRLLIKIQEELINYFNDSKMS